MLKTARFMLPALLCLGFLQPDGNIIAVGQAFDPSANLADLALAHYLGQ